MSLAQCTSRIATFLYISVFYLNVTKSHIIQPELAVIERDELLEPNGTYRVQWKYFPDNSTVEFEISAETTGFVGFGLSPIGGMVGADIVIGGVLPSGTVYFSVRLYLYLIIFHYTHTRRINLIYVQLLFYDSYRTVTELVRQSLNLMKSRIGSY